MSEHIAVLVVENDLHIRRVLEYNLKLDGFEVFLAGNEATGLLNGSFWGQQLIWRELL